LILEQGRNNLSVARYEGFCDKSNLGRVGDEFQFMFECPKLERLRNEFIPQYNRIRPNVLTFHQLFNSPKNELLQGCQFLFNGM
jgi:hypothetical protein